MDIKVDKNTVVVFDLDDTLYNEIDYLKSAYIFIAKKVDPSNWKQLYSFMFSLYRNKENVFDIISEKHSISKTELIESYRNHKPNITLFDGVLNVFKAIINKGAKIGIITDGRNIAQTNKIEALKIKQFIDCICISENIGTEKPSENNFKFIQDNLPAKTYYYLGDNLKKDFIAPNTLGWKTIALIDNGLNIHSNSFKYLKSPHLPDNFILSIKELNVV